MSISMNVARFLQQYRLEHGLTFQELADRIGFPKSSTEIYVNGTGNPRSDTLDMLALVLNVPIEVIVSNPVPWMERVETILRTSKELSGLSPERRERCLSLCCELAALFAEENQT